MENQFIFIIDDARIEAQALLLMATLDRHCAGRAKLIAYVPEARMMGLSALKHAMIAACQVEIRSFSVANHFWRKPYPHGNKIIACADAEHQADPDVRRITFFDSDMLAVADLTKHLPQSEAVLAAPEGLATWGGNTDEKWRRAYGFFDLELPQRRVRLTRGRRLESLPYFNAGLVSFSTTKAGFAAEWLETARLFDRCPIANKRPWLDQISLPLALARGGFDWQALPEEFNYSLTERKRRRLPKGVIVAHYHRGGYLSAFPGLMHDAIHTAMARLPSGQAADLLSFLKRHLGLGLTEPALDA